MSGGGVPGVSQSVGASRGCTSSRQAQACACVVDGDRGGVVVSVEDLTQYAAAAVVQT